MRRRTFLRRGGIAAAALVAAPAVSATPTVPATPEETHSSPILGRQRGSKFQLSLAAYSFRQELGGANPAMTLNGFVDFCAREGLDATELTSYYFRDTSRKFLTELRRRAYVNGLAISGTPIRNDFCKPPGPARDKEIQHVKTWIDHVSVLGSQTIRVFAGGVPKGGNEAEARARAIEGFREVARYAGDRGVLLALENHGGITSTAEQLLALVRGVDSPWFGVNLDTGNFRTDPYGSMEKVAPYAVAVQVKVSVRDASGKKVETDFPRVAAILRQAGYRGYVALEYEEAKPTENVPRYLKRLREALDS